MTTPPPPNLTLASSDHSGAFVLPPARDDIVGREFVDRRQQSDGSHRGERRQFGNSHADLSDDGRELAVAIDRYKIENHRRYLTCDEMLGVLRQLGYTKS